MILEMSFHKVIETVSIRRNGNLQLNAFTFSRLTVNMIAIPLLSYHRSEQNHELAGISGHLEL